MRARHHAVAAVCTVLAAASPFAVGCKKSEASDAPKADVVASEHGFTPSSLTVPTGGPGSHHAVTFVRTSDKTCATEVVIPELKIDEKLPLDQPVAVFIPTDEPRTLTFQCGMAMYKGAIVVTPH
jgi:plastocyanin domain-containing protein